MKLEERKEAAITGKSLKEGDDIFVSFDGKTAKIGKVEIAFKEEYPKITVLYSDGSRSQLYSDEVHLTKELALKFSVTM